MGIDALAAPGHKSLFGLQGCGILALCDTLALSTLIEGGSGMHSRLPTMPEELPERLEAGTLPVPAIAGLLAGVKWISELGLDEIKRRENTLFVAAKERLLSLGGITVYEPNAIGSILLFHREGEDAAQTAEILNRQGICVRAGLHCAPQAHEALRTPPDGAVRVSFSPFNTLAELDALYRALQA
jgi:selenocysteine lyase/cysteine desulfurase